MEKTEAESVDDMVDASSRAVSRPMPEAPGVIPRSTQIARPVRNAVIITPIVARITPWAMIGRTSDILVSIPPEKRMIQSAIVPMVCAICISPNSMPRISEPLNIPTDRKSSRAGTPNLELAFPA